MTEEKLLNAKMEHYSFEPMNFKAESELMVTITLSEYRELARGSARYDALLSESYKRRNAAETEAAQLRERIRGLQKRFKRSVAKMCEICHQNPCHPRCPNADEPKIIGHCDSVNCGEPLREDYTFFTDNDDNMFCSLDCALAYYGIHEKEYGGE